MRLPEISVVVIVYNNESTIASCLSSILCETSVSIEVICVDDASQDGSVDIINDFAKNDSRVIVYRHDTNLSAHISRRDGAFLSNGNYIWFIDGDDTISPQSIANVYNSMILDPVDILHFNTTIVNRGNISVGRIRFMEEFVKPYDGKLVGNKVFSACFKDNIYRFSIWNKLFNSKVCKKAFSLMESVPIFKAQDKYEYFVISFLSKSYRGDPSVGNYEYNFGFGLTGSKQFDSDSFRRFCSMSVVAKLFDKFIDNYSTNGNYLDIREKNRRELIIDCINNWLNNVREDDKKVCFEIMKTSWGVPDIVSCFAYNNWYKQGAVSDIFQNLSLFPERRPTRTIATYYHTVSNGGVQRVLCGLVSIWISMGYSVVVITDVEPSDSDYSLPDCVTRCVISPASNANKNNYYTRGREIQRIIEEYDVDTVVYHAWVSNILLWDMLIYKLNGVSFIVHCHNNFSILQRNARAYFAYLPKVYRICDCVVTLSEMDACFWKFFNGNVHRVINPFTFDPKKTAINELSNNNIIWIARISPEKRPKDAVAIMSVVVQAIPDAKLIMVGKGVESLEKEVQQMIIDYSLENVVQFDGFTLDVESKYRDASIFLCTSEYEGYPTTLTESQSIGIPCVMYSLPYLSLLKDNEGIIQVKNGDVQSAANEIINLLRDRDKLKKCGNAAFNYIKKLSNYDYQGTWESIFDSANFLIRTDDENSLMWDTLLDSYHCGATRNNERINALEKKLHSDDYFRMDMHALDNLLNGDYRAIVPYLKKRALEGDKDAMFRLAQMYRNGRGVPADPGLAREWMQKAIEAGHSGARRELILMESDGRLLDRKEERIRTLWSDGSDAKLSEALELCRECGDASAVATLYLARAYLAGRGVEKDIGKSVSYYLLSIDAGSSAAASEYVEAVYKNSILDHMPRAVELCKEMAASGNKDMMFRLAQMYRNGRGVPADPGLAREWMQKAIEAGHSGARRELQLMG